MTRRLLTIATVLTLSASLAYAGQRQRNPNGSSSGERSSGGQAAPAPAPAPPPAPAPAPRAEPRTAAPRAEPRSAPPPSARQESGGGSQIQRWGSPRSEAATPPAPRTQAPTPPPSRQEASGGSQIQRWGAPRQERQEQADNPNRSEPAPMSGLFRSARERQPSAELPSTQSSPLIQTRTPAAAGAVVRESAPDGGQRVAQPRQRYPNPSDQQQASGVAVPRGSVASPPQRPGSGGSVVFSNRPGTRVYYNNYYYYPRASYPYGYGSYGLGYFYYDPYAWYDNYYYDPYYPTYSYPSYAGGVYQYRYNYPTGEIRLQVRPRHAEVYVDGYYAGRVDDFDGFLQGLRIEEGPHTIEIVAPGYETLTFNVRILPGRKIDYRGDLRPYRP